MAKNDYSRRSKKDVFWGDETTTTPYDTLSENSETANDDTEDDFDVEKFIRENDSKITTTVTAKIVTQILAIGSIPMLWKLWVMWVKYIYVFDGVLFLIIIFGGSYAVFSIAEKIFSNKYTAYIERAAKSFKKIKLYRHKIEGGAAWKDVFYVTSLGNMHTEDLTRIEIGDTIVKALEVDLQNKDGKTISHYFYGVYYEVDLGDRAFADNVMLVYGSIQYVKERPYIKDSECFTIYAFKEDDVVNSDMNRVYNLAQNLLNHLNNSFIINFKNGKMYFIIRQPNIVKFNYNVFDYTIKDRLRRDINELQNRIKIAEILASA